MLEFAYKVNDRSYMYLLKFGMHGCSSTFVLVVNAEVDSMGGVVEGGVGIANKTSPRKAAIDKAQAELWQEYGVRDQRRKELEFLEKGGDPLDFKLWNGALVSVQSTSITDQHPDQFVTSEAKGSFAFTASTHGDSVESSGRPGTTREPNSADNLMLFDADHGFSEGGRSLSRPSRSDVAPSKQSFQVDTSHKPRELGDSATINIPRKAYKRRYRSKPNRDGARSSSTDVNPTRGGHGSSLASRYGPRDVKGLVSDAENQNISSLNQKSNPTSIIDDTLPKTANANDQVDDIGLGNNIKSVESTKELTKGASVDAVSNTIASKNPPEEQIDQKSPSASTPNQIDSNGTEEIQAMGEITTSGTECQPSGTPTKAENQSSSCQMNGFIGLKGDDVKNDAHNHIKLLDSESSCTPTILSVDGNNDSEMCTRVINADPNGNLQNQTSHDGNPVIESDKCVTEKKDTKDIDNTTLVDPVIECDKCVTESAPACQSQQDNGFSHHLEENLNKSETGLENKVKDQVIVEGTEAYGCTQLDSGSKLDDPSVDNLGLQNETSYDVRPNETILDSVDVSNADLPDAVLLTKVSTVHAAAQTSSGSEAKWEIKIDEDSILKEAKIIEAKRKRIAELSIVTCPAEVRQKSHWDHVLEEMAWLANDFAQERIWKIAAASQVSYRVAVTYRLRKQGNNSDMDAKRVAHTLAKAVMEFWQSVQSLVTSKELEQQRQKNGALSVRAYAVRLLKCIKPSNFLNQAEVPLTPDRTSDLGVPDMSWEDNLTEENLFYAVPSGAGETYRMLVESHVTHCEKIGSTVQEEVETSACDAAAGNLIISSADLSFAFRYVVFLTRLLSAAEFEYQDNPYHEDEGETSTYNTPVAFESSKSSIYGQKKRKHLTHADGPRTNELGSDLLPIQCAEIKLVTQHSALPVKRPGSSLNVSIPTKRVRTASRRVISPFSAGASGCIQVPNKTDASSCDTNSFQDDRGLPFQNSLEVESAGEFENQLRYDSLEVSTKPKKKKKAKHLSGSHEQRWQVDSSFQNEQFQRDPMKKRSESYQLESNGNSGLLVQPMMKKPKLMRQSHDNSFDNILPSGGSVPSPVASQMSNMSNPNKFFKMLGGRDRGRKAKGLKMPAGQPGSGSPWSLFEDQALVVLVHDLGPNWELVGDAINSTLHFKCIFRKAKECKERHNFLMDGTSGDGAESAEDSGSSQPYPSTLPGIPKGSARQLFQRLQGPMEEDTLKSHFEKIMMIGQKPHYRRTQLSSLGAGSVIEDPKQLQQPHSSHTVALSQVCPNNLNGGHILTPLDLCDVSGPDILSLGYVGPRPGSLPADEQRLQQYNNQMIPGRNIPQPNISASTDRGVRMTPGGNGMGMMGGANRSLPMPRPGFPTSPLVNPGGIVAPVMSSANMHAGVGAAGQGSSMMKPRDNLHMMRPGLNQDTQRQTLMPPDLQIPGNSQGSPHFSGLNSPFSNQTPPVSSSYPVHHQLPHPISPQPPQVLSPRHSHFQGPSNHAPNPQQQAFNIRLAKERQLQHRLLQQQLPMQNNSQVQPQTSSQPTQGGIIARNAPASALTNQTGKQRQKQQNQLNRQHPQQRQQSKAAKGVGRGNMTNVSTNGVSKNPGQYVASQSTNQPSSSKNLKTTSHSDSNNSCHQQTPSQQKLANQNQTVQINSDPSNKPPVRDADTGQHPTNSSADMDTVTALPQVSNDLTNAVQVSVPSTRQDVSTQLVPKPQQTAPTLHSQQQPQILQAGNDDLYEPRLE
ncbi:e1a-binding protein p400 [Phtheirospermum japonicum]|uniref:E1a-binding protein p400 n=1 Tax=Phtheirospermum japonicum TaxID=374723 RepID=A0A830BMV4_9LAMI|nr:e1a-binding protein p400 [Phtheirospermum japonicum]